MSTTDPKSSTYVDNAIKAVRDGVASDEQRREVVAASKQAGARGNSATAALQNR